MTQEKFEQRNYEIYSENLSQIITAGTLLGAVSQFRRENPEEVVILAEDIRKRNLNAALQSQQSQGMGIEFVKWYSGMEEERIRRAFERFKREFPHLAHLDAAQAKSHPAQQVESELKIKSDKWDKLYNEIAPFYEEGTDEEKMEDGLISIGEIAASHLGFL